MRASHLGCIAALAVLSMPTGVAKANCQLQQLGTLPVDMQGLRPVVSTRINGVEARLMLDTGAFYSTMWRETATQYQLPITSLHGGSFYITGVDGSEQAWVATARSFEFLGKPIPKVQFIVIDHTLASDFLGVLGENLLQVADAEYDLANGVVRFFKPVGCERQPLAYWAVSTPYSSVDLESLSEAGFHLSTTAMINGRRVVVWFDTGASTTMVSLEAAERAGITPKSPGVTFLGTWRGGIGPGANKVWSAPIDTFQLGGEKVQHTHLLIGSVGPEHRIGQIGNESPDVILGDDYFLSHRIYVSYSQKKIYFTYNGGPLFNLDLPQVLSGKVAPPKTVDQSAHASATTSGQAEAEAPADADGLRRQGMAYAAMHELDQALTDLTRACTLAPNDARNYYDRGLIYRQDGQFKAALADFGSALKLQPDDIDAHLARAQLLQFRPDADPAASTTANIKSDLDAVGRLAPPSSSIRLTLDDEYDRLGDYPDALSQINEYLDTHPLKREQAIGLNNRCWLRATANQDLSEGLKDCDRARGLEGGAPDGNLLDSRGLVYLRLRKLNDSKDDYDSALHIHPNMPTALYGRGLAELLLGEKAQGQADLDAAAKIDKGIAQRFAKMGLTP